MFYHDKETGTIGGDNWTDCKQELPLNGDKVLICISDTQGIYSAWHDTGHGWRDSDGMWPYTVVTHWMPLPAPPQIATDTKTVTATIG